MSKDYALDKRYSIVVATPHDLDMLTRYGGQHKYSAPPKVNGELDYSKVIRAHETTRPVAHLWVEFACGPRQVTLYELDHSGELLQLADTKRLMGSLAAQQYLAVSRMGGRFLSLLGRQVRYCHPARIVRHPQTGAPVAAEQFAIPQPIDYAGDSGLAHIGAARALNKRLYQLLNYYPQDMVFWDGKSGAELPRHGAQIDVDYQYDIIGYTPQGVPMTASRPKSMQQTNVVAATDKNTLLLVHWEALIEGLRLGAVSVEEASRLVFPYGVQRRPDGQQGSVFTGLGCYSAGTLQRIFYRVKT